MTIEEKIMEMGQKIPEYHQPDVPLIPANCAGGLIFSSGNTWKIILSGYCRRKYYTGTGQRGCADLYFKLSVQYAPYFKGRFGKDQKNH